MHIMPHAVMSDYHGFHAAGIGLLVSQTTVSLVLEFPITLALSLIFILYGLLWTQGIDMTGSCSIFRRALYVFSRNVVVIPPIIISYYHIHCCISCGNLKGCIIGSRM